MKKNLYSKGLCAAFATCAFMASPSMFADADVTSDLLLHYTFDSMSGDVIENQAATGAEYNATSRGGGAFISTENFYDGSGSYKLTSTQSDFLLLPNNLNQKFTNFTISTWVYGDAFTTWSRIFDFGSQAGVNMFLTYRQKTDDWL